MAALKITLFLLWLFLALLCVFSPLKRFLSSCKESQCVRDYTELRCNDSGNSIDVNFGQNLSALVGLFKHDELAGRQRRGSKQT